MLTAKGNISAKVAPGRTYKRHLKIERVVRLTAAGYSDEDISYALGVHKVYVSMLRRSPEYAAIRSEVHTGLISEEDALLRQDIRNIRAELREMVPAALLAIRDAILDKSNPKIRFEAAKEIMDREGSIVKVSKTEVKVKDEIDYAKHDGIASDLLAALQQSTHTALNSAVDSFISTNVDEETQTKLHASLELENLDTQTATLQ